MVYQLHLGPEAAPGAPGMHTSLHYGTWTRVRDADLLGVAGGTSASAGAGAIPNTPPLSTTERLKDGSSGSTLGSQLTFSERWTFSEIPLPHLCPGGEHTGWGRPEAGP